MVKTLEVIVKIEGNDYKLTLDESTSIQIIKQISDIREFSKRTNPYTQAFTIPANANNNKIFKHYNNLNTYEGFKTNKQIKASILDAGKIMFDGTLQMNKVTTIKGKSQYEVTCYNILSGISDNTGNVRDLDLSIWNHIFDYETVVGSWDTFVWRGGIKIPFQKGLGYVYPYNDYDSTSGANSNRINDKIVKTEFFKPHPYAKTIWDAIYEYRGLSYESKFLNSPDFTSLIITPDFSGLKAPTASEFWAGLKGAHVGEDWQGYSLANTWNGGGPRHYSPTSILPMLEETTSGGYDFLDPDNVWSGYVFTVPHKSIQDISVETHPSLQIGIYDDEYGNYIPLGNNGNIYKVINEGDVTFNVYLKLRRNGVTTILDSNTFNMNTNVDSYGNSNYITPPMIPVSVSAYQFLQGDEVWVDYNANWGIRSWISKDRFDINAGFQRDFMRGTHAILRQYQYSNIKNKVLNEYIEASDPVIFNNILPEMTQTEFINSIVKMFNLYIYPDPNNINVHIIEPYSTFFGKDGQILDWNRKQGEDVELIKEPLNVISSKEVLLTYSPDTDYLNDKYTKKYSEVWGQYLLQFDNDFKTGQVDEKIKFSPTPLVNEINTDKIITKVYKMSGNTEKQYETLKTRILYYNLLDCNDWTIRDDEDGNFTQTRYPYSGFLDNPFTPTVDLDFFVNKEYYHTNNRLVTMNNLYEKYWSSYYGNLLLNPNILTGYFHLTTKDIYEFSFRDLVYFKGNYYIVNKIEWDMSGQTLAKVELIISNFNSLVDKSINSDISQFSTFGEDYNWFNGFVDDINRTHRRKSGGRYIANKTDEITQDYINTHNVLNGRDNWVSTVHKWNTLNGNSISVGGDFNYTSGENLQLNGTNESLIIGTSVTLDNGAYESILLGSNIGASASLYNNLLLGDNNHYNDVQNVLLTGNDIYITDRVENSLIIANGVTISGTWSNQIIFSTFVGYGETFSGTVSNIVNYISLEDIYDLTTGSSGKLDYIPLFTGTHSLTASNFYIINSDELTNGSFNLDSNGHLILGSTISQTDILTITSATNSNIVIDSTSATDEIGGIYFNNSGTYNSIISTKNELTENAYAKWQLNVNTVPSIIADYGPRVGIGANDNTVTFNIKDSGVGYPFQIVDGSSTILQRYHNDGWMQNVGDIELTTASASFIEMSPDTTRWRILVDNHGTLNTRTVSGVTGINTIWPYKSITSTYSITNYDYTVECLGGDNYTVTLPTAVGYTGQMFNIKSSGTGSYLINGSGGETIDYSVGKTFSTRFESFQIQSNGSSWIIV